MEAAYLRETALLFNAWKIGVRAVMDALHSRTELADRPIGERARTAAALFQAAADQQGICLKLRRKPKRR